MRWAILGLLLVGCAEMTPEQIAREMAVNERELEELLDVQRSRIEQVLPATDPTMGATPPTETPTPVPVQVVPTPTEERRQAVETVRPPLPTPTEAPVTPSVAAQSEEGPYTVAFIRTLLLDASAPAEWIDPLIAISWCESRYRPDAENGVHKGLWQINQGWFEGEDWRDPWTQARVAVHIRTVAGSFGSTMAWAQCWED